MHTTVDAAINWFRKNSLWPMPMGLACCGIELMASGCSRFDISRFGSEVMRFSPAIGRDDRGRHGDLQNGHGGEADLRSNGGAEMGDRHGRVRQQGGMYRSYAVLQGVDQIVPVDVYIAGCLPGLRRFLRA